VLAGLVNHPRAIAANLGALSRARLDNPAWDDLLDALLDAAESGQPLENQALVANLAKRRLNVPTPGDYDGKNFPFVRADADAETALAGLNVAITLLVELPEVEQALHAATMRADFDEAGFQEQTRLRQRKAELERQLKELMRR